MFKLIIIFIKEQYKSEKVDLCIHNILRNTAYPLEKVKTLFNF